jgi:hypothetical protein
MRKHAKGIHPEIVPSEKSVIKQALRGLFVAGTSEACTWARPRKTVADKRKGRTMNQD